MPGHQTAHSPTRHWKHTPHIYWGCALGQ